MKLYVDRGGTAPSPRRVRIFLAEKGIEVPTERLALHQENRTPGFLEKNPTGTLPVLELDDGRCIAESLAICRYFEGLQPEPSLFGRAPVEQAWIEMWTRRVELNLYLPIDLGEFLTPEAAEVAGRWAQQTLALLDRELGEHEFIAGERYCVADIFALSALDFGIRHKGFEIPAKRENLRRWHRVVSQRPSASV